MKMKLLGKSKGAHDCSKLIKRLFPKMPKNTSERYPTRVFLCAYMVLNHPEVVFNRKGEREAALSTASKQMTEAFERLVQFYLLPAGDLSDRSDPSVTEMFNAFDDCWVTYLEQFVAWKLHDAAGLAESLIKMASKMQLSMLRKVKGDIDSDRVRSNSDLMTIVQQVQHDHALLRERVQRLEGQKGVRKFEEALEAARQKYEAESGGEFSEGNVTESDTSMNAQRASESEDADGSRSEGGSGNGGRPPRRLPLHHNDGNLSINLKKEVFIWELLYDRNYQMQSNVIDTVWESAVAAEPPPIPKMASIESSPASMQKQFTALAEKAFWDSVEEKLTSDPGGAAVHVCTMLMEIGTDLSSLLPNTPSAKIVEEYLKDEEELMKLFQETETDRDQLGTGRLLSLVEHTSELLRECGPEARNAAAVEAQQRLKESIVSALEQQNRSQLVKAVCRALRLLYAQLKALSFDLANARIRALSSALTGPAAIKYSQDKFASAFGLTATSDLSLKLPQTQEWIQRTSELRHSLEYLLEPLNVELDHPRTHIPISMRSGRMASSSKTPLEQWPEVQYVSPVALHSWKTAFRIGLIDLVSQPLPLTSQNVPETMRLDVQRLHNLQNAFQQLVVMSASLLTVKQVKGETVPHETLMKIKSRLVTILQHPNVNLSTLTSELVNMAGIEGDVEQHINNTLINLINREKSGFKALNNGLIKAMSICLVAGDACESPAIKEAIQSMLSKIGSGYLLEDLKEVANDLSLVVGINEAVHAQTYADMF